LVRCPPITFLQGFAVPNIDQNIDYAAPHECVLQHYDGLSFGDYHEAPYRVGYSSIPLKVYRLSTNRNIPFKIVNCRVSPFHLALTEWYRAKPSPFQCWVGKDFRKALKAAKVDWRKKRPVRSTYQKTPIGWVLTPVPTGEYGKVEVPTNMKYAGPSFSYLPVMVERLRPKKLTRRSPHYGTRLRNNDLYFFRQSGFANGVSNFNVTSTVNPSWPHNENILGNGSGKLIGRIRSEGADLELFEALGYSNTQDPFKNLGPYLLNRDKGEFLFDYADVIDDISQIALRRHYQKLKSMKIDLATGLAQAGQTVTMIGNLSERLIKSLRSLRKGNVFGALAVLFPNSKKELANDRLLYQYGIRPLLSDIKGATEHLAEFMAKMAPVKSNGHAKKTFKRTDYRLNPAGSSRQVTYEETVTVRVKYGSTFVVSDELARQASQLGITDPKKRCVGVSSF
jgi:hypothetical protein